MTASDRPPVDNWLTFRIVAIYLVARFLWAVLVPGGEWPLPPWHYVSMGIDLALLASMIVMRARLSFTGPTEHRRTFGNTLFGLGLVAGVGLILIRFTSDAAWWTGHLRSGLG